MKMLTFTLVSTCLFLFVSNYSFAEATNKASFQDLWDAQTLLEISPVVYEGKFFQVFSSEKMDGQAICRLFGYRLFREAKTKRISVPQGDCFYRADLEAANVPYRQVVSSPNFSTNVFESITCSK